MPPLNYALAVVMLSLPYDGELPDLRGYLSSRWTLHELTVAWEICDPKESWYCHCTEKDFPNNLKDLRRWYFRLQDHPSLLEASRFPSRDVLKSMMDFNRLYLAHLDKIIEAKMDAWKHQELLDLRAETVECYRMLDALADAQNTLYCTSQRRIRLAQYRNMIGETAFNLGLVAPSVPYWRFARID